MTFGHLSDGRDGFKRVHRSPAAVVGVLERDESRGRVVIVRRPNGRLNLSRLQDSAMPMQPAGLDA